MSHVEVLHDVELLHLKILQVKVQHDVEMSSVEMSCVDMSFVEGSPIERSQGVDMEMSHVEVSYDVEVSQNVKVLHVEMPLEEVSQVEVSHFGSITCCGSVICRNVSNFYVFIR